MNRTIEYYEQNANSFVAGTLNVEFTDVQDRFLRYIPNGGRILDFGCGSGRDTGYFLQKGYLVEAIDGSEALCRAASEKTGIAVKHMLFSELDKIDAYDGIWACASILHLPKTELKDVFEKVIRAIKSGGYLYTSFKYGEFEGIRGDRYFTDFTEETFDEFVKAFPQLEMVEEWISRDARPGRGEEKWLNAILRKSDSI